MIQLEILLDPVAWAAPRLSRNHAYDPKQADKRAIRFLIAQQYTDAPIEDYVALFFIFMFEPPKSVSKKKYLEMIDGKIIPTKSDCTNLQKLYEDCLKKIVIVDDRNVEVIGSRKLYGDKGKVLITVMKREEYLHRLSQLMG